MADRKRRYTIYAASDDANDRGAARDRNPAFNEARKDFEKEFQRLQAENSRSEEVVRNYKKRDEAATPQVPSSSSKSSITPATGSTKDNTTASTTAAKRVDSGDGDTEQRSKRTKLSQEQAAQETVRNSAKIPAEPKHQDDTAASREKEPWVRLTETQGKSSPATDKRNGSPSELLAKRPGLLLKIVKELDRPLMQGRGKTRYIRGSRQLWYDEAAEDYESQLLPFLRAHDKFPPSASLDHVHIIDLEQGLSRGKREVQHLWLPDVAATVLWEHGWSPFDDVLRVSGSGTLDDFLKVEEYPQFIFECREGSSQPSSAGERGHKFCIVRMHRFVVIGQLARDKRPKSSNATGLCFQRSDFAVAVLYQIHEDEPNLWVFRGEFYENDERDDRSARVSLLTLGDYLGADVTCLLARHIQDCVRRGPKSPGLCSYVAKAKVGEELYYSAATDKFSVRLRSA